MSRRVVVGLLWLLLAAVILFAVGHLAFSLGFCADSWVPGYDISRCVFWFFN